MTKSMNNLIGLGSIIKGITGFKTRKTRKNDLQIQEKLN